MTQTLPGVGVDPLRWTVSGERHLDLLRWGLVPVWAKELTIGSRMINARAETVREKPAFRSAFRKRRCLVPADSFYEWKKLSPKEKQSYAITTADPPYAFAGLWEGWKGEGGNWLHTYSIITTSANEAVSEIHDRMLVILPASAWPAWLGEDEASDDDLAELLRPYPAEQMRTWMVGRDVGNVRNDHAGLVEQLNSA